MTRENDIKSIVAYFKLIGVIGTVTFVIGLICDKMFADYIYDVD